MGVARVRYAKRPLLGIAAWLLATATVVFPLPPNATIALPADCSLLSVAASVICIGRAPWPVAMVAQDLVVSKQPEAFHTHDIPSVHGSGAFGLALQSNTPVRTHVLTARPRTQLGFKALNLGSVSDTFGTQWRRCKEHPEQQAQRRQEECRGALVRAMWVGHLG